MGRNPSKRTKPSERRNHPRSQKRSLASVEATKDATRSTPDSRTLNKGKKAKSPIKLSGRTKGEDHRSGSTSVIKFPQIKGDHEQCLFCQKSLRTEEKVLFVEEDIGHVFCSEPCITSFFGPEIEKLENQYFRNLDPDDLTGSEREKLAHLRWITLEQPDEVWKEKTISGLYRYTLISQFKPGTHPVWCVCICLFLRGEPSFLYLAFPTKNAVMVDHYRKGEPIQLEFLKSIAKKGFDVENLAASKKSKSNRKASGKADSLKESALSEEDVGFNETNLDRLAEGWSEDETRLSQNQSLRREDDIRPEDFGQYKEFLEKTLESPEELWASSSHQNKEHSKESLRIFHFIRHYPNHDEKGFWYIIIARELREVDKEESTEGLSPGSEQDVQHSRYECTEEDNQQLEILEAFPTRDVEIVQQYRQGINELGENDESGGSTAPPTSAHTVH